MTTSATRRMAKSFTWLSIGDLIGRGINFFTIIFLARVLGAASFGLLNFAQAILSYLVLLVDSGLSLFGTREIARSREKAAAISLNVLAIRFIIAALVFTLSSAVVFLIPLTAELRLIMLATFLFIFCRALNVDWVFQGLERMEFIAAARILNSLFVFVFVIILVKTANDLIKVPLVNFIVGLALALFYLFIMWRQFRPSALDRLATGNWWDYFSEALPLGATALLAQIYTNLDSIMLWFMATPKAVGYYSAAYKVYYIFAGFLGLWQASAFPIVSGRMARNKTKAKRFLGKYLRLTLLIMVPVGFLAMLTASPIIKLLFGNEYAAASTALQVLIWDLVIVAISGVFGGLVLVPSQLSRRYFLAVAAGAGLNIILNLILIPYYGFIGAAVATLVTEGLVCLLVFYFSQKVLRLGLIKALLGPIIISLIAFMFFSFAFQLIRPIVPLARTIIASLAFVTSYFLIAYYYERRLIDQFVKETLKIRKLQRLISLTRTA